MMNEQEHIYELVEKYCHGLMDDKEKLFFEIDMETNPALANLVYQHQTLIASFDHHNSKEFIRYSLDSIHKNSHSQTGLILKHMRLHVSKYWRTASVAAVVAVTASILTFLFARSIYKKDTQATYQLLKGEINTIKKDQKAIISEVNKVKRSGVAVPDYPSKYSGTGFAISKNGYLVTNLHVVDGYSKIFTFTEDGSGHESQVVVKDEVNDLAILKINEDDFRFDGSLPYSIKKSNINLARRIYSLGFPKNEIVYNEGYISSETGFNGDSNRFQLELPSSPGVSGAPILDESGNILGIISGKQSQTEGVTFAIHAKQLLDLVKDLPDFSPTELSGNKLRGSNRSAQISQIQPFICMVKVYN